MKNFRIKQTCFSFTFKEAIALIKRLFKTDTITVEPNHPAFKPTDFSKDFYESAEKPLLTIRNCEYSKSRKIYVRGSAMSIPLDGGYLFVTHKSLHGCGNFFTNLTVISEFLDF